MALAPEVVVSEIQDGKIVLILDQPVEAGEMNTFEVAGEDGKFVNASATANGNVITILSPLASPLKLRYAWKDNPVMANVRSVSGLPMSSFELIINK